MIILKIDFTFGFKKSEICHFSKFPQPKMRRTFFFYFLTSDVKCTVLGDTESKKTQMIFRFTLNGMDNGDIVDQFECYSYNKFVEDEAIDYKIFDTETSPDKSALRGLSHPNTDVFIICFSLVHPKSLENVEKAWVPEAKK